MKKGKEVLISIMLLLIGNQLFSQVIPYPATQGMETSKKYSVTANGKNIYTYDSPIVSYANFDMNGKVDICIKANRDVKWVDIRPRSLNLHPTWSADSTIHFTLDRTCKISIELNGEVNNFPLFLFANAIDTVVTDRKNPDVVFFESGKIHKAGLIHLKSNQTLYIAPGAVVDGFIFAENAENIKVCGKGVLLGTNNRTTKDWNKNRFIHFKNCKNITINDIQLVDATTWQILLENSENVRIDGLKLFAGNPSDDGLDIVRSRNVLIENCFVRVKDDCVAIKGHFNYPDSVITENIKVKDCTFWNAEWGNAIEIGFELQCAEVRDIVYENIDIIHVDKGAAISIHNGDKAKVSNIHYDNIRIEDCNQKLFDFAVFYSQYSLDAPHSEDLTKELYLYGAWDGVLSPRNAEPKKIHAAYRGSIENIQLNNISVLDGIFPYSLFCGYDENHKVSNIRIKNLKIHGKKIKCLKDGRIYSEFAEDIQIK